MSIGLLDADKIKQGIMGLTENALDFMEVVVPNRENYEAMRRKILRKANDLCRRIDHMVLNGNEKGE
jgi:hypothetical protein